MNSSALRQEAMARLGLRPSLISLTYEVSWQSIGSAIPLRR